MEGGLRAICRVIHFASLFGMGMFLAAEHLDSKETVFKRVGHMAGIGLLISGIINWLILRKFKREDNKKDFRIWTMIVHSKIVAVILLFTPFSRSLISNSHCLVCTRISVIGVYCLLSPYARMLRETCQAPRPKEV